MINNSLFLKYFLDYTLVASVDFQTVQGHMVVQKENFVIKFD